MRDSSAAGARRLFPTHLSVRAPRGLQEAIEVAARAKHTGPSEWIRQTLLGALAADGVHLTADGHVVESVRDAGGSA
jgi:hypothetical protein